MNILSSILSIVILVGLPLFVYLTLFRLVSGHIKFKQEEARKFNSKRLNFMDWKIAIMQEELKMYRRGDLNGNLGEDIK